MFLIRRVYDLALPINRDAVARVQEILREQFPGLNQGAITKLPDQLHEPLKQHFRSILFVAENGRGRVLGFALLIHAPDLRFCYLDYISAGSRVTGRGIGGALYQRVRDEAKVLGTIGLFFECLPDDPRLCPQPELRRQNAARLRFYERWGARPVAGTAYETPVQPGDDNPPYLVFDDLGSGRALSRDQARNIVRAILERKYPEVCPVEYVEMVVGSIRDDPVRFRPPRYVRTNGPVQVSVSPPRDRRIALVINDRHEIHHVHERGYVEAPVRIAAIDRELATLDVFLRLDPRTHGEDRITTVHDRGYVGYFKRMCELLEPGKSVYPYVFPIRNGRRPPQEMAVRAGYYCIDTFTPLNRNAYLAARRAVDCALTGASTLIAGQRLAYALVRPPGHHAEKRSFGGFCYFNNGAVAAQFLSEHGKVAILDIDYHHGNGQQDIFYGRSDVLTVSLHGHPRFAYPYFSGFEEERGEGDGKGYNLNLPLPEHTDGGAYREHLRRALRAIRAFAPSFLVVSLGLDTARGDPTGTWTLTGADFEENGRLVGALGAPTLVVQEGGYRRRTLGANARRFFLGLWQASFEAVDAAAARRSGPA